MYLALDLGDKKCGIAIYIEGVIIPKGIFPRINIIKILKNFVSQYNVTTIIVGLPYDLYGIQKKQLDKTNKFIAKLNDIFPGINIDKIDERFTSIEAKNELNNLGLLNNNESIDDISATLILESYLKQNNIY